MKVNEYPKHNMICIDAKTLTDEVVLRINENNTLEVIAYSKEFRKGISFGVCPICKLIKSLSTSFCGILYCNDCSEKEILGKIDVEQKIRRWHEKRSTKTPQHSEGDTQ